MKKIILKFATAFIAFAPLIVSAQNDVTPAPLMLAQKSGLKIISSFNAEGGMKGWVVQPDPNQKTPIIVYSTPDNKNIISGMMIGADGKNLTASHQDKYVPKPDYSIIKSASYVEEKNASTQSKGTIYVFKDPNCGYCHLAWKDLQPAISQGLTVKWVLVSFLGGDSPNKASALFDAADPSQAIKDMHAAYDKGVKYKNAISQANRDKLRQNAELMESLGFTGTPATVWQKKDGSWSGKQGGLSPDEIKSILKD